MGKCKIIDGSEILNVAHEKQVVYCVYRERGVYSTQNLLSYSSVNLKYRKAECQF